MGQLTEDEKRTIERYVFKFVVPSGLVLSILAFLFGFFVNDVARTKAYSYSEAFKSSFGTIRDSTKEITAKRRSRLLKNKQNWPL